MIRDYIALAASDQVVRITDRGVAFAVLNQDGTFGRIVVDLEPGQQETITIWDKQITVIRDYVQ